MMNMNINMNNKKNLLLSFIVIGIKTIFDIIKDSKIIKEINN